MNKVGAQSRLKCARQCSPLSDICHTSGKTGNSVHMNLASKSFLGFLVDPLDRHPRSLNLQEGGIAARGVGSPWIGLEAIATRPSVRKGLLSFSLSLDLGGDRNLTLPAVDASAARTFADAATTDWTNFNRAELEKEDAAVRRILKALDVLTATLHCGPHRKSFTRAAFRILQTTVRFHTEYSFDFYRLRTAYFECNRTVR